MKHIEVELHTDGACSGNPGPGGIGAILVCGEHEKEYTKGIKYTTNNQMEMAAIIFGLSRITHKCKVKVCTDSKLIVDTYNKGWIHTWKRNGWKSSKKRPVKNIVLWKLLDILVNRHIVTFKHVKGHAGNVMNERCDILAVSGSKSKTKIVLSEFIKQLQDRICPPTDIIAECAKEHGQDQVDEPMPQNDIIIDTSGSDIIGDIQSELDKTHEMVSQLSGDMCKLKPIHSTALGELYGMLKYIKETMRKLKHKLR